MNFGLADDGSAEKLAPSGSMRFRVMKGFEYETHHTDANLGCNISLPKSKPLKRAFCISGETPKLKILPKGDDCRAHLTFHTFYSDDGSKNGEYDEAELRYTYPECGGILKRGKVLSCPWGISSTKTYVVWLGENKAAVQRELCP